MSFMQPLDPKDPRAKNAQIAASIRAAILSGELPPGSRLPSVDELARFFGVGGKMTVDHALRTLRDEGFITTRAGSGSYVRDQAALPVTEQHALSGLATFLFEMGHLKNLSRAGWLLLGISDPETVAEHSFRVAMVSIALAAAAGADVGRAAALGLVHDAHETRIGDVPSVGRAYVTTAAPEAISAHQTADMPHDVAKVFQDLTAEYEAGETLESRLAHDADKIETLLQAIEYQAQGYDTTAWCETSRAALRTEVGQELAQAISASGPYGWFAPFQASYHELRAAAQKRAPGRRDG
jgi:putative hydrolase of HD superfamily